MGGFEGQSKGGTRRGVARAGCAAGPQQPSSPPAPALLQEKKLPPIYRGKWATASKEEVDEMLAKGVPHCYRFRVPKSQVVTIQVGRCWVGRGQCGVQCCSGWSVVLTV